MLRVDFDSTISSSALINDDEGWTHLAISYASFDVAVKSQVSLFVFVFVCSSRVFSSSIHVYFKILRSCRFCFLRSLHVWSITAVCPKLATKTPRRCKTMLCGKQSTPKLTKQRRIREVITKLAHVYVWEINIGRHTHIYMLWLSIMANNTTTTGCNVHVARRPIGNWRRRVLRSDWHAGETVNLVPTFDKEIQFWQ